MATTPVISRTIALNIISLVDYCYRKGVEDAHRIQDEGLARQYIEKMEEVGVYGFLNEDGCIMDWKEWTLRLMAKVRMTSWNGPMTRYFQLVGAKVNQNYLGAFIPISQRFYVNGVRDYTNAPDGTNWEQFKGRTRAKWTEKGLLRVNNRRYVDEIQLCTYDLKRRDSKIWEEKGFYEAKKIGAITEKQADWFIRAVGLAMIDSKY